MTGPRRIIARVLSDSADHPDVEAVYNRAIRIASGIMTDLHSKLAGGYLPVALIDVQPSM